MKQKNYRKHLKGLVRNNAWEHLGYLFGFKPVYLKLPSGRKSIDWCCVPANLYSILQGKTDILWPDNYVEPAPSTIQEIPRRQRCHPPVALPVVNVKGFDTRQLEHFGDAIVNLAARIISAKEVQRPSYFLSAENLASNRNLQSAGLGSGSETEVIVGTVFVESGIEKAFSDAIDIIKKTAHYKAYYTNK